MQINLLNTYKLYHVITSHNIKRTLKVNFQNEKIQFSPKQTKEEVILDLEDYIEKAYKELKDETITKKISNNPTNEHMKIVTDIIETLHRQQILAKTIADNFKKQA